MKKIFVTTLIGIGSLHLVGQTLVNKVWDAVCSSPDTIDIVQTVIDPTGRLVMTGNTKVQNQQNNTLTVVRNPDGTQAWSQSFNGSGNGSDYGTCVTTDAFGHVYVGGATYGSATTGYDFLVLKYTSSGVLLWSKVYSGLGNGYDVVAGLTVNNSGDVFVTGASKGTGNQFNLDYATIKYNAAGTQQWVSRYNNLGMPDVPCSIALDGIGNIFVAGGSGNSIVGADIFVVKYSPIGTQTATYRHSINSGNGWDRASAMSIDGSGCIFLTGNVYQNNLTCDIRTLKLSNTLALQWSATFNGDNKDDCANSLALDNAGNVCIAGYSAKTTGGKDFTTIKYNSSGTLVWERRQSSSVSWNFGEARKVTTDNSGNVYVAGEMDRYGTRDYLAMKYDANGNKQWEDYFSGTINGSDRAFDLNVSGDDIYVSGKTATTSGEQYSTVKYEKMETPVTVGIYQGNQYVTGEVTVRFSDDPNVINHSAVDNKDLIFGIVGDFVSPSTILSMNAALGTDVSKWKMAKIFPNLLTTDTISVSRLGEDIRVPAFWASFRIFPSSMSDTTVAQILNKMQPAIWYAEVMPIIDLLLAANDNLYSASQASLHSTTTYPNANINVESAWDIEVGKPFVRLGIFDSGIDQAHDELNGGKVGGGYDYVAQGSLAPPYDNNGHGTSCGGIAAAYRNNNTGVAGIAGGDGTSSNPGVTLFDCHIVDDGGFLTSVNLVNQAIVDGAKSQSIGGFGLQVMSNSWKTTGSQLLRDAIRFAHDNDVIIVAARGNDGNTTANYPSCYYDPQVISVGSTSIDGNYQNGQVGSDAYSSSYQSVDIAAPGTSQIIQTTENLTNGYRTFTGTSAATPHVAGVAALMVSNYNMPTSSWTNLAPEDVENIMTRTAIDVVAPPCTVGGDQYTGAGRIDAGACLDAIQPGYKIHHYGNSTNVTNSVITPTQISSSASITNSENYQGVPVGNYLADVYKVTHTLTFNDIGPNEQILDVWVRQSSTFGFGQGNPLVTDMHCDLISYTTTQLVIETYVYNFWFNLANSQSVNYWLPTNFPAGTSVAATIYTKDLSVGVAQSDEIADNTLMVFPNPAVGMFTAGFSLSESGDVTLELVDAAGRLVLVAERKNYGAGYHEEMFDVADLAKGMYILLMRTDNAIIEKKVIIENNAH